jgi:hypothetical protein
VRSRHFAILAATAALCACGCSLERSPDYPKWRDRVELFSAVEKLAVVPVREGARIAWPKDFDAGQFTAIFADEIVRHARFKVIYPRDVLASVEQANRETLARCRAEKHSPTQEEIIDLARTEDDAVAAGQAAGADAVLVVTVDDFEVYPPKRLALRARVYLCAAPSREALDVIQMSEAGVPLEVPVALREKFIWERQKHYDSLRKSAQTGMEWYARKHGGNTGFGEEVFYYSTERFLGFVADDLSGILCDDANRYKRRSWLGGVKKTAPSAPAAGPAEGGSGFEPEHGEHGVGR